MGDHGHHDPGGHELEAINTKMLFRLLLGLTPLTLIACIAVIQWFNWQVRELDARYAVEGSVFLEEYQVRMGTELQGVEQVAQGIVAKPDMLKAPAAPSGWVHPDDLAGGPAAAPAEHADDHADHDHADHDHADHDHADEPIPVPNPAEGAEGAEGDAPAEPADAPAEPKPEPEKPAKPEKPATPADDKPAKPAKPEKPATPADDKADAKAEKADN